MSDQVRVDAHCHAARREWHGEGWWRALADRGAELLNVPTELLLENIIPALFDDDGSMQLATMDQGGIDVAVMFAFDWSLHEQVGGGEVDWRGHNAWYADLASRSPNRIRWGFGVDPRQSGAVEAFTEAVGRGAVCLKLHPGGGWAMDDPVAHPLLERARYLEVPVVMHVGPLPKPLDSSLATPARLDEVAAAFPDLSIQAAHTGNDDWRAVVEVAERRPNVSCEISGWQADMTEPDGVRARIREVVDRVGPDRVMWGTDAPYFRPLVPDGDWAATVEDVLSEGERAAVMGGTATRFFGLD